MANEDNSSGKVVEIVLKAEAKSSASFSSGIKRGELSWNYFYVALAFAVSFMGTIIQLSTRPLALILFILLMAIAVYFFLFNRPFQNQLIALKNWYENIVR